MVYSSWTLNGTAISVENVSSVQVPASIKQKVGRSLVRHEIVGRDGTDWELRISGNITGSTKDTIKAALDTLRNDLTPVALVNGVHDGNYIIEELSWSDEGSVCTSIYKYSAVLIQYNQ